MEKEFQNWMSRVAHAPTELFHGDGIYAGASGCKRLARECATAILDFGEDGEKNINSTYSAICVIAYNLHPPVDAKVWLGWMREKLDEVKRKEKNYMPTKRQIKAMQDIIADLQYRKDAGVSAQNKERAEKNEPPLPYEIVGEQKTPSGYMVLDGYVGVYYHEPMVELPHAEKYEREDDRLRCEIEDQLENGDYYLVNDPFSGSVKASKIRELLKEHSVPTKTGKGRTIIDLKAEYSHGTPMEGYFNALYVRRAVEALGGDVRLYIGKHRINPQPRPFLIVVQDDTNFNLDRGAYAIVMPLRK